MSGTDRAGHDRAGSEAEGDELCLPDGREAERQWVTERVHGPLAPGLYLVATPIGNLEDITLRALRVLREADVVACEDTRQTAKLLRHYGIRTPTVSYHMHNEAGRAEELVGRLKAGERVAVVSDAGTPAIADPGAEIVDAAVRQGVSVYPVPGANAAVAAAIASGTGDRAHPLPRIPPGEGRRAADRARRTGTR